MSELPKMNFGHLGIDVIDIDKMVDFYTNVLGFKVTDRGMGGKAELAFLSRNPEEHHQIVMAATRKEDDRTTINQISFRVDDFKEVRQAYDHVSLILRAIGLRSIWRRHGISRSRIVS